MSDKLKNILTILGIYVGSILLSIILAPVGGGMHSSILDVHCAGGLFLLELFDRGCNIEGFVYFYIFLLAIFSFSILKQKTAWIVFIIGTIIFWGLASLFVFMDWNSYNLSESIGSLIIMLVSFAVGYAISFGIKKLKNKYKKGGNDII